MVKSDDKKKARLNCISHLLSQVPYEDVLPKGKIEFPERQPNVDYVRPPLAEQSFVPEKY